MINSTQRKAFNFYQSHWEQIKLLNDKQKLDLFNTICEVQFLETSIDDISFKDKITQLVWTGIKHSINTSLSGFINKQKALKKDVNTPLAKGLNKGGFDTPNNPPCQQEEEEEQYVRDFEPIWKDYTLGFIKSQGRNGGSKKNAFDGFKKLRSKYELEEIKELVLYNKSLQFGHKDLERILRLDVIKQYSEEKEQINEDRYVEYIR